LRSALVARDEFLGVASHELNTPLTSLKLQMQIAKRLYDRQGRDGLSDERLHKLINGTLFQLDRLGHLVGDMLDVSRINSGKLSMNLVDSDISALVAETLERLHGQIDAGGGGLHLSLAPGLHTLLDPLRIEQVLTNFTTNALKYAPGRALHVSVERIGEKPGGRARVSFRDEGNGIAPEHQERIFAPFERATSANEVSGLGLGLYICLQIIEQHGGTVSVASVPGEGATFSFELPLND
ncbi:MAG: HAMP domain-containing histidine kinase, partial [Proteobacteria bacterium]